MTSTSNMDCRVSINTVKPANDIKLKNAGGSRQPSQEVVFLTSRMSGVVNDRRVIGSAGKKSVRSPLTDTTIGEANGCA